MWNELKKLILSVFYPDLCPDCGEEVLDGLLLCSCCRQILYHPQFFKATEDCPHLESIFCFYHYAGGIKKALHGVKFSRREDYLRRLCKEILQQAADLPEFWQGSGSVAAVPVPTDPKRLRDRGYDIPEEIFYALCREKQLPWRPFLKRVRLSRPQYGLSRAERRENLAGCFSLDKREELPDTAVLLDDILTTGSTLDTAALTLKKAGVKRIYAIVLASGHD
jgi:ComF family protein